VRAAAAAAAVLGTALALPGVASAHGISGRADLPIPPWLFGWAAAIVLAASFAALGALWQKPRLQDVQERRLFRVPRAVDVLCGAFGMAWFGLLVYAGFAGSQVPTANIEITSVYVIFWVGFPVASVLFGDVFRALNPWRSLAVTLRFLTRGPRWRTRAYPERLGYWPAALGIVAFGWLELAYVDKTDPSKVATIALAYAVVQLVGMAIYGIEPWSRGGDAFGVYFNLYSQLSALVRREGVVYRRPLLSGAPTWPVRAGAVGLLAVAIGVTTFDGFSNGPVWASLGPDLANFFGDLGFSQTVGIELSSTVGLIGCVVLVGCFYRLGIQGMHTVSTRYPTRELMGQFVHTLIPIAFAYLVAHYFSLFVFQGQAMAYLISDPLGDGSNIFGTAHNGIDYFLSSSVIWYVQVGALICGHVAGLVLAHDRALALYKNVREATRSQYWMLVVMVGFTSLGLWLLSAVGQR
jgi:hypothetical protein